MKILIRSILLALALAAPVAADEGYVITPLPDRWYMVIVNELVPIPPGGRASVTVWLDDIPGGVESAPMVRAKPTLDRDSLEFSLTYTSFVPTPYAVYPTPQVSVIVKNESAAADLYRIKVYVRGKE